MDWPLPSNWRETAFQFLEHLFNLGMGKNKCPTGVWKGEYFFDLEEQKLPDGLGVGFDLRLTQS